MQARSCVHAALGALLTLSLFACGPSTRTVEFSAKPVMRGSLRFAQSDAERHGFRGDADSSFARPTSQPGGPLTWSLPQGWQAKARTQFRAGSFAAPGGVDVSLSVLPGAAGGLRANLDRWRSQMGLGPISDLAFSETATADLLGESALVVDCEGSYAPAGIEQARMLGRMLTSEATGQARTVFVKMVGGADAVTAQAEALESFCQSLAWSSADEQGPMAAPPGGAPFPGTGPTVGPAPTGSATGDDSASGGRAVGAGRLGWEMPETWTVAASQSSMRLVTFNPASDAETEVYVVILRGTAGGMSANFDRWLGQVGAAALREGQLSSLPTTEVFDAEVPVLEAIGTSPTGIVGLMAPLGQDSLFLKMVGPKDRLRGYREEFERFANSLSVEHLEGGHLESGEGGR